MTADEIRAIEATQLKRLPGGSSLEFGGEFVVLREIAAQLAELNENFKACVGYTSGIGRIRTEPDR